ncbi:MAG TPA: histidine kinase, partial [Ornithinibacter sp.]|nr:histidine kinase [Ornithinibacter sp.]
MSVPTPSAPPWQGWQGRGGRWGPGRPPWVPMAVALAVFQVLGTLGAAQGQPERRPLDLLGFGLLLTGPAALACLTRRSRVPVVTVVVGAATALYLVLGYPYGPVVASLVVALVAAVVTGHRLTAWLVATGVLTAHAVAVVRDPGRGWSWAGAAATLAWALLVLALGEVVRVRRERALSHRRAMAEERRRRAGEGRLRIAQELHDVVAHHMSLINVQASVALHLRGTHPEQVDEALRVIKGASKEALVELRSLIDVLREGDEPAPRHPAATLAALDDLVERSRYAGLAVTTHVTGPPAPLAAGVELAAYRVVQEAVTNVVRHSGAD